MNLKQLSELLGLSQTTVSRALNGYPEVSEKTRKRVEQAAALHNYAPSQSAQGLATGKSRAIGHVLPLAKHRMINPHFADFVAGAGEAYSSAGYDIVMAVVEPDDELSTYRRLARTNRVDGFVIQAPLVKEKRIDLCRSLGLPFVVHGRLPELDSIDLSSPQPFTWLDVQNQSGFRRATDYLLDLGHRRIALLNGMEHMNFARMRRLGFEDAMAARNVPVDSELMLSEEMIEPYGFRAAEKLMSLPKGKRPTAFLCSSRMIASGVQVALSEMDLKLGKDVSLVTFDDRLSAYGTIHDVPRFTSLRSSIFDAGKRVAELVTEAVENPDTPNKGVLWDAELVLGRSTGPVQQ